MLNTQELDNIQEQLHNNLQHFEHYYTQVSHFQYSVGILPIM